MVGPKPSSLTLSSLANSCAPAQNNFSSDAVSPGIDRSMTEGHASLGHPPMRLQSITGRTPGSRAVDCAKPRGIAVLRADPAKTKLMSHLPMREFIDASPLRRVSSRVTWVIFLAIFSQRDHRVAFYGFNGAPIPVPDSQDHFSSFF